jgi:hypothetical protein
MVIQKYTDNLYASEVYRELERTAVRKGHFKPTEEQQIKIASQQVQQKEAINKPIDATPSDDLVQDVARLAYAMRRKGYVAQADDLEQKLVLFKKAESSLYDVTPEKNKDFIQFGHRDGDVEIIEGSGDLGTIETIESLADKIKAVTLKQPTGKLPGKDASLREIASFIKSAQLDAMKEDTGGDGGVPQATDPTETDEGKIDAGTQSAINQIKAQLKQVGDGFLQMQSVNFDDAMTTFLHGEAGKSSVFNTLGGNQYGELDKYGRMYKAAYGKGQPSAQTIQSTLINNPQGANQYLQSIGVQDKVARRIQTMLTKLSQHYGYNPAPAQAEMQQRTEQQAQKSQQDELAKKVQEQAQQIAYSVDTQIKQQQQRAQAALDKVNTELKKRADKALQVGQAVNQMAGWSTNNLRDARNFYIRVKNALPQIEGELANVQWILKGFGMQDAAQKIQQGATLVKGSLKSLQKGLKGVAGSNIPATHGRLLEIRKLLQAQLAEDKDNAKAKNTLGLVNGFIGAITKNQAKGEKAVLDAIQGGYGSWQDLDYDTVQLLDMVKGGE